MTTTILLVDDHALFRQGLASLIGAREGLEILATAGSGEEALELVERLHPKVVVLDVEMPGMNGIETARQVREIAPETRILALSMYGDPYYWKKMLDAGASAYVLKNEAVDELMAALDAVLSGKAYISPGAKRPPVTATGRSAGLDRDALTKREIEVLRLLAEGQRVKEVAETLGISAKTVETHRSRMMLKLGIENLAGLVRFAIRTGIASSQV